MIILTGFFKYHRLAFLRGLALLKQKPWSTAMTVLVMSAMLMLLSLSWLLKQQLGYLQQHWHENGHIFLYLKLSASANEAQELFTKIQGMSGIGTVHLITPEEGFVFLSTQEKGLDDIIRYLPNNPLPYVLDITPDTHLSKPISILKLSNKLKSYSEVDAVEWDESWLKQGYSLFGILANWSAFLTWLLAFTVILVVGNTLRLILLERFEEIRILELVGATASYIRRPFLYSGLLYGLFSAFLSIALVNFFIGCLRHGVNSWAASYDMTFNILLMSWHGIVGLLAFAMLLGWFGARVPLWWVEYSGAHRL